MIAVSMDQTTAATNNTAKNTVTAEKKAFEGFCSAILQVATKPKIEFPRRTKRHVVVMSAGRKADLRCDESSGFKGKGGLLIVERHGK